MVREIIYGNLRFHQTTSGIDLLRPNIRYLMGWIPPCSQSWWLPGHQGAIRNALSDCSLGHARRPQRNKHSVDRPRRWKGRLSRVTIPFVHMAVGARWYAVALLQLVIFWHPWECKIV